MTRLRARVAGLAVAALVVSLGATSPVSADGGSATSQSTVLAGRATAAVGTAHARAVLRGRIAAQRQAAQAAARKRRAVKRRAAANPLANRPMGVYKGPGDQAWAPYANAGGETKRLLGTIALAPKAKWFGDWIDAGEIEGKVRKYVANASGGDSDTLVQMAVFNLKPWEHEACRRLPSGGEQASYRRWIDAFARGVGDQHTALILQPDGPFALCAPGGSTIPSDLIAYASKRLSALPNTSVYIDGGAADWPPGNPGQAVDFLVRDGIRYARGVALNSTHYSATGDEVERGTAIVTELARRGISGKHVVVNTSSNGRPFVFGDAPGKDPDNATVCGSRSDAHCVTLGIKPTTDVADARWGLSATQRAHARQHVDGYLWFGRPWLYRQADPFDLQRALQLVRTTPW